MIQDIKIKIAANITYSGLTYNTPLIIEYKHTGKQYFYKKGRKQYFTDNIEIANENKAKGIKVTEKAGYYFINRMAIPTINANMQPDIWYITNGDSSYLINKVSKYAKKLHSQLSNNINPFA